MTLLSLLTVTKDKFGYSSDIHRNRPKEVVVAAQSNETLGRNGTLEPTQDEDGGSVRY
jgi:hypothetical protein